MTAASLSVSGTEPELRDELIIVMMSGAMAGRHSLARIDGMGSRLQVVLLIPFMSEESSNRVTGENLERGGVVSMGRAGGEMEIAGAVFKLL